MIKQKSEKINRFWLGNVRKEIRVALERVKTQVNQEFPKDTSRLLSKYEYKDRKIRFHKEGFVCGGTIRLLFTLIDFSFIRNILADCYSDKGGLAYDPVTMFLLELIKLYEDYTYYTKFCEKLKDPVEGKVYRDYVGITSKVPDDVDMHNFRNRIGEERFQAVMGMLVELFKIIGIISGQILCTDGTLIESFAKYRGCNFTDKCCKCMDCPSGLFKDINAKVADACLAINEEDKRSKIISVEMQCPRPEVIEKMKEAIKIKKKKVSDSDIARFSVLKLMINRNPVRGWEKHVKLISSIIGTDIIVPEGYGIEIISSAVSLDNTGRLIFCCPKACKDVAAKTGYRRDRNNPNKNEPIFGYKLVIMTSVEVELGLELPIMVSTGPGNINEALTFLKIHKKLKEYSAFQTEYHIMDSGYDFLYVYDYIREQQAVPIIDYNYRREKLTKEALRKRGYDEIGRPYAPCGRVCSQNGYDAKRKSVKYICGKGKEDCKNCGHGNKKYGYTKSMLIKDNPRLTLEVPRCSKRYREIKNTRSSSERTNSYSKHWAGLTDLRLKGTIAYAVRAVLVCIVIMLKKIAEFIAKMTLYYKDYALAIRLYGDLCETTKKVT